LFRFADAFPQRRVQLLDQLPATVLILNPHHRSGMISVKKRWSLQKILPIANHQNGAFRKKPPFLNRYSCIRSLEER
jgi:hypothetical protein